MTHACIKIFNRGEKRSVLLHTYHTGQDTVEWVKSIPGFYALHRGCFLWESKRPPKTKKELRYSFDNFVHHGQLGYAPSVAALLIAVRPDCYEPVPEEFAADMAQWSGADQPYTVEIYKTNLWVITDLDGNRIAFPAVDEAVKALWKAGTKRKASK